MLIARIHRLRHRQHRRDGRRSVASILPSSVYMVESLDQLQVPSAIVERGQRPSVRHTVRMPGEDELSLQPLVACTFVEGTARHFFVLQITHFLADQ